MEILTSKDAMSRDEAVRKKIAELKSRVSELAKGIPFLKHCSRLSFFLQGIYQVREVINQLEQMVLQNHLKCCISPNIKVPGEVILAVSRLSQKRHGAIIAIEQESNLDEHLEGGTLINAGISSSILENIFYPGSPLHDGAVVIKNTIIRKANCLLPLAPQNQKMDSLRLATRHRAALGLSQVSDALIIVISEEKGWVSMALRGQFYPNLGTFALLDTQENSLEIPKKIIT
ncbi:MAG: DNA integrity scanning protein DisA nucleotide-binding domain protein [Deltaproteobacteria bacterium]|nr:DNA integrity scanning protein DisA nucleotide-binding domain protein [Deltaproteobacteria bacterium]